MVLIPTTTAVVLALGAAMSAPAATRIETKPFGKTPAGEAIELFTMRQTTIYRFSVASRWA